MLCGRLHGRLHEYYRGGFGEGFAESCAEGFAEGFAEGLLRGRLRGKLRGWLCFSCRVVSLKCKLLPQIDANNYRDILKNDAQQVATTFQKYEAGILYSKLAKICVF